jgi:hypothetical protein
MQQYGTIEFHGPKQILNINNTLILLEKENNFIPGDKVYLDKNNKPVLYERIPQAVIGIVKSLYKGEAYLYLVNFGVNYEVISDSSFSKSEVLNNCAIALRAKYQQKFDIGEHLSISELYTLLNRVEGVSDVVLVEIVSKNGTDYSSTYLNLEKQTSPDGRYIKVPKNVIMELKYPFSDIKGTVR